MNLENVILRGTSGAQPAANTVPNGTLYFQTDTSLTQRSNGTTWDSYSSTGSTGGAWSLISSISPGAVDHVDFTGLSGFSDIRVLIRGITFGSGVAVILRVSTDNGVTFLSSSGDYVSVSGAGAETNTTSLLFTSGTGPGPFSGEIFIEGFSLAGAPKAARSNLFSTDAVFLRIMPSTTAFNALRVTNSGPVNFTAGTIFVFGR